MVEVEGGLVFVVEVEVVAAVDVDGVDAGEMFCRGVVGGGRTDGAGAPLTIWSRRFSAIFSAGLEFVPSCPSLGRFDVDGDS